MRAQYAMAFAGGVEPVVRRGKSAALGLFVMFTMLAPVFAVCGFMLAQILGYIPR